MYVKGSDFRLNQEIPVCTDIPSDLLSIIFKEVFEDIGQTSQKIYTYSLVCKKWHKVLSSPKIGAFVFNLLGWTLPQENAPHWKSIYRTQSGNFFKREIGLKPKETIFPYPLLDKVHQIRIQWIENRGVIFYRVIEKGFKVFMFNDSKEVISVETSLNFETLAYFNDLILCGSKDGTVTGFNVKNLKEPLFTKKGHPDALIGFFAYQKGWLSISKSEITYWDSTTLEQKLLKSDYNPQAKTLLPLSDLQCRNGFLFFTYQDYDSLTERPYRYQFSLKNPQKGFTEISGPKEYHLKCVEIWGDQIGTFYSKPQKEETTFTITRMPFKSNCVYEGSGIESEHVTKTISWSHFKKSSTTSISFYYRGDSAFVITRDYPDTKMQLIDLKDDMKIVWEHSDPLFDPYRAPTIEGNQFIYLRTNHQVVVLDFPTPGS